MRSLESPSPTKPYSPLPPEPEAIREKLLVPNAERFFYIRYAFQTGMTIDEIFELTRIDRWFLSNMKEIFDLDRELAACRFQGEKGERKGWMDAFPAELLRQAKMFGFSSALRSVTQGRASFAMTFSHYEVKKGGLDSFY